MTGNELREKFLRFFETKKGHLVLPSFSLIPKGDPTLLLTGAGMVPLKPYFTGAVTPPSYRITTAQKCVRTGDIENVGKTARHHTFFEMLGNFSIGDYFKEEVIPWAWEFVTEELKLPKDKLWVTIYQDDDEAFEIWHHKVGVPKERIIRLGKKTNFWEIGPGPCGPCSEIYIDLGPERGCGQPECGVGCDCDRYLEIWNLVFIQFNQDEQGNYHPLPKKSIDTGMGLERIASVMQKVASNFETDLIRPLLDFGAKMAGIEYGKDKDADVALKVIADHGRAVTFLIGDGVLPSNEGRGYVLRRILRRSLRYGRLIGLNEPFLYGIVDVVCEIMGKTYPNLIEQREYIKQVIKTEEERFQATLEQGMNLLQEMIDEAKAKGEKRLAGELVFRLYDTYGFPSELTEEIAMEQGMSVDREGFDAAMEAQRERARAARAESDYKAQGSEYVELLKEIQPTDFVGYDEFTTQARVLAIIHRHRLVKEAMAGQEVKVVFDRTPYYAASGGQVSDTGTIISNEGMAVVDDVLRIPGGRFVHQVRVKEGILREGTAVQLSLDTPRRLSIMRNHTATHLLHQALRKVLGGHVNQAGSLVEPDRLRFDFSHYTGLTSEELERVEEIVNQQILNNTQVSSSETTLEQAKAEGVTALFDEKYGEKVRVVRIGDFSAELCGGTHVKATGEIGLFKLVSEGGVGAGLRRMEAVTGKAALRYIQEKESILDELMQMLKVNYRELPKRVEILLSELKEQAKTIETLQHKAAKFEVNDLVDNAMTVNGIKVVTGRVHVDDLEALRGVADLVKARLGSGVVVLGAPGEDKVNFVAMVTKDLLNRGLHAGNLIREVAKVADGGGGGKPDMAQAGGKNPAKLEEALQKVVNVVQTQLAGK